VSHTLSGHTNDYVTINLGLVTVRGQEVATVEDIIRLADQSLYQAKRLGRNQVFVHP
jgi:diguanylate cyclase (GGDEF)-like protein